MNRRLFTIIELLIVITIVALLTVIAITKYQNIEDKASDSVAAYNAAAVDKFILTYKAANGMFPSNLHTGLNEAFGASTTASQNTSVKQLASTLFPPIIQTQIDEGLAHWGAFRHTCLSNVGVVSLSAGEKGEITQSLTDSTFEMSRYRQYMPVALYVDSDWFTTTSTTSSDVVRFNGQTLFEIAADRYASNMANKVYIMAFFFGPTTNTQSVYRADGSFWKNTKASMEIKLSEKAQYFNYPVVFFLLHGNTTEYLGCCGISDDGLELVK